MALSIYSSTSTNLSTLTTTVDSEFSSMLGINHTSVNLSAIHSDILLANVLTRLDGPTLASAACATSELHSLATSAANQHLWSNLCDTTWHSTTINPRVSHLVANFLPHGPRSFFASSYSLLEQTNPHLPSPSFPLTRELISAVDIHYKNDLVFSKVVETETLTGWFRCSPFRIDLIDPKDVVLTPLRQPDDDVSCRDVTENLTVSWILIDPIGRPRTVNLSSGKAVSVQRHWLSGEVQIRYASILAVDDRSHVQVGIVVTCGGSEEGKLQVREVSLQVEDMDGKHLNGKDSLVILEAAFEGKKGRREKIVGQARDKHEGFLEMKRERSERQLRRERRLDSLCVAFGITVISTFFFFISCT